MLSSSCHLIRRRHSRFRHFRHFHAASHDAFAALIILFFSHFFDYAFDDFHDAALLPPILPLFATSLAFSPDASLTAGFRDFLRRHAFRCRHADAAVYAHDAVDAADRYMLRIRRRTMVQSSCHTADKICFR